MYQQKICIRKRYASAKDIYKEKICISKRYVSGKVIYQEKIYISKRHVPGNLRALRVKSQNISAMERAKFSSYETGGFHGGGYKDSSILGYDAV